MSAFYSFRLFGTQTPPCYGGVKMPLVTPSSFQARESSGIMTNDFLSRLLALKKNIEADPNAEQHQGITPGILTAQGSIFILAGYLTTVLTLEMVYYALDKNQVW